jgi:hypothetical protein
MPIGCAPWPGTPARRRKSSGFPDLTATYVLEQVAAAPPPVTAAGLSRNRIAGALNRARRRDGAVKAERITTVLCTQALSQPPVLATAYAATVPVTAALNTKIATCRAGGAHLAGPDAELYCSQPGLGEILVLGVGHEGFQVGAARWRCGRPGW